MIHPAWARGGPYVLMNISGCRVANLGTRNCGGSS